MAADFNPFQAPLAPVVVDFIAFEPRRRPIGNFVAAVTCFGVSALLVSFGLLVGYFLIAYHRPTGGTLLSMRLFVLVPFASATIAFFFAGRASSGSCEIVWV